jgi:hypothetical protein
MTRCSTHQRPPCRRSNALRQVRYAVCASVMTCTTSGLARAQAMEMAHDSVPDLRMTGPLGVMSDRQGSGTSWIPEAVLMPFRYTLAGGWYVMAHWNVFGQLDAQGGRRGDTQVGSINWSMVMASRPLWGGRLQLRAMNSIEALTVGRCGYPLLTQSGETCHGRVNADRQHPHDFFMETAVLYERALTRRVAWSIYLAPSGEPALGPVAFMHRPSALNDPAANITHHWQDATHISFGVASAALYGQRWKLEGSAFNAREPDEHRWNFDLRGASLRSASGRFTVHPSREWSASASYGFLHQPEPSSPGESMHRASTSLLHARDLGKGSTFSSALVWGANRHDHVRRWEHSALAEGQLELRSRHTLFARAEHATKSAHDLAVAGADEHAAFPVSLVGVGYVREIAALGSASAGIGARASVSLVPESLRDAYGSRTPVGVMVFLRLRPRALTVVETQAMMERLRHAAMGM